jgi:hypothetical protein
VAAASAIVESLEIKKEMGRGANAAAQETLESF